MTTKEAILKSLEELNKLTTYMEIYNHIVKNKYYDFGKSKTPALTISASLTSFIQKGDNRVRRIKNSNGYSYYLSKNESNINFENNINNFTVEKITKKNKSYNERDLHKLLSSYLKNQSIYSKTIFHEQSKSSKDNQQKWIHPDMIGIKFLTLKTKTSQTFLKAINQADTFKITSYELKKEINTDYELKKSFFQAVSNSSWANYGYLVAFEISDSLEDEMERLNQSFGIGIIKLKQNPYESKILYQSKYRELDFKTLDKLCKININFDKFIEQTETLITVQDKYFNSIEKEFDEFCDDYFINDTEINKYCLEKNIPIED
ncbi:MAG: hypothetical protein HN952_04005 [Candidatus Cloacimonetes bacterium]|jgi:uncharacterized protein|nr:hypothetical protein [Candidatus Cloacimonadota bacterium]MBT6994101.1 hypothetical protein [Candidatus Cloacimonadota bacterium]